MNEYKLKYSIWCTNCTPPEPDEENKLELIVQEEHTQRFNILPDGKLDQIDADACQEVYLQCPLCGAKYEFETNNEYVIEIQPNFEAKRIDFGFSCYNSKSIDLTTLDIKLMSK